MIINAPKTLAACLFAATLLAPGVAHADRHWAQDMIAGNGTVGPYPLSWKHVQFGSESVTLDGATLHWGADYAFDPDQGTITFTHPLPVTEAAEVGYGYDTTTAQEQVGQSVPLSLALNRNLSLDGQFAAPHGDAPTPGSLNFGLSGGWQNAHGGALTTHLLFLPALTGPEAQATPNGLDRVGLAVDGRTGLGRTLSLGFSASRAGSGLGIAGGGWAAGQQRFSLSGVFTPTTAMQATVGYAQTDPTAPGGSPTQTLTANATLKPSGKGELDAAYAGTSSPTPARQSQTLDLKASLTPDPRMSLNAEADRSVSGAGDVTQTLHANAVLKPTGQAQVDATFDSTDAPGQANDTQALNLQAALTPNKFTQLTANVALNQRAAVATQATTVSGAAQPSRFLQVAGGYTWRSATASPQTASDDSGTARVTLAPLAAVQLVGTYDRNPSDGGGGVQRRADSGLSLQTGLGCLSLTGGYTWSRQDVDAATTTGLHVGVGLKFSSTTRLTGDYKRCLTDGAAAGGTDAYTVGLTRDLGDAFDLSLNGTLQQQTGAAGAAPHALTASASLGMKF